MTSKFYYLMNFCIVKVWSIVIRTNIVLLMREFFFIMHIFKIIIYANYIKARINYNIILPCMEELFGSQFCFTTFRTMCHTVAKYD
jgi:hypothetical protein